MARRSALAICLVDPTGFVLIVTEDKMSIDFGAARERLDAARQLLERNLLKLEEAEAWERSLESHREWLQRREDERSEARSWGINTQHKAYSCLSHARVTPETGQEMNRLVDQRQNRSQRVSQSYQPPPPRLSRAHCQRRQLCGRTMRSHKRQ